jgi:hypothetical protein
VQLVLCFFGRGFCTCTWFLLCVNVRFVVRGVHLTVYVACALLCAWCALFCVSCTQSNGFGSGTLYLYVSIDRYDLPATWTMMRVGTAECCCRVQCVTLELQFLTWSKVISSIHFLVNSSPPSYRANEIESGCVQCKHAPLIALLCLLQLYPCWVSTYSCV